MIFSGVYLFSLLNIRTQVKDLSDASAQHAIHPELLFSLKVVKVILSLDKLSWNLSQQMLFPHLPPPPYICELVS